MGIGVARHIPLTGTTMTDNLTQSERDAIMHMKPGEAGLLRALTEGIKPRDAGERLGIHWKRVEKLCWKWADRGWYEYGTTADLGWLTPRGNVVVQQLSR